MPTPAALQRPQAIALDDKPFWTIADFCRATGFSRRFAQTLLKQGRIPFAKIGSRVLLDPAAVRAALFASNN